MTVSHRKLTQKFFCDKCQANVTDTVRVTCVVCSEFDLCIKCFSKGAECGSHKNSHPYRIESRHRFPIFTEDWSADEELLLIEGLMQFGMGNWAQAAEHVGTKTKEECEEHYLETYVNSEDWPLPDINKDFSHIAIAQSSNKKMKPSTPSRSKPLSSQPTNHEIAGYMPGRVEFETEYENDAEQHIKDMTFNEDDTPEDTELKQIMLEIYNNKLERRIERKLFIFERGLLEYRKTQSAEKKLTREERDLLNQLKVFAWYQTHEDYKAFSEGHINELRLRNRLSQLQDWRRNGITTFADGEKYEIERAQRISRIRTGTIKESAGILDKLHKMAIKKTTHEPVLEPPASSKAQGRKPAAPLDIQNADGVHLLNPGEQQLCSTLRILPRPYLVIKETILKEYAKRGSLRRRQARDLVNIDVNKTGRIYDFFVESGWIQTTGRVAVAAAAAAAAATTAASSSNATPVQGNT
ncbi:Transcriptional adapter ada2 [Mycoemilia scoparia]|uniref:Transcriptional adapter 2 n=1 Tax=Mycoemilia scoparia TaxID=417184 RepID=A0A9W8A5D4_9FUNG|nr:Transcriptional adapter ada2 [Mycoemilia scoparia]